MNAESTPSIRGADRSLAVFQKAHDGFFRALASVPMDSRPVSEYSIVTFVQTVVSEKSDEDSLWASVFVKLWCCSNFDGLLWQRLVQLDRRNIRYALEHCWWVLWVSGADGTDNLRELIQNEKCWDEAGPRMRELAESNELARLWLLDLKDQ